MQPIRSSILKPLILSLLAAPSLSTAQTVHVVQVMDNSFQPQHVTIQEGDIVHWENATGGNAHNVVADDMVTFHSGAPLNSFSFQILFSKAGEYPYHCQPHRIVGMTGSITVEGDMDPPDPPFNIDPGHSGNWWNGLARSGEGAQIEVSEGDGGTLVFVVTFYSYGPAGGQIFLIAVGTPDGDTVDVDVFITDGPVWGDDFDPADVDETQWGTGTFKAESCDLIHMSLMPNATYQAEGYTDLEYDLVRLTTPAIACPYEG